MFAAIIPIIAVPIETRIPIHTLADLSHRHSLSLAELKHFLPAAGGQQKIKVPTTFIYRSGSVWLYLLKVVVGTLIFCWLPAAGRKCLSSARESECRCV